MNLNTSTRRLALFCLLPLAGMGMSHAANISMSFGTGGGGFDSRSLYFGTNLGSFPLYLDGSHYQGISGGDLSMQSSNLGLDWQINDPISAQIGYSRIDDDIFIIKGPDLGMGIILNNYFGSDRLTMLNLGYGRMDYKPDTNRDLPQALLDRLPEQTRYSIGLVQGITDTLRANVSFDKYDYTSDPKDLAIAIAKAFDKRGFNPPNAAYTIAGFPENSVSIGLGWETSDSLGISMSLGQTKTATGQKLRDLGVGVTHYGEKFTFGVNLSFSNSSSLFSDKGNTVVPGGSSNYVDFNFGFDF